MRGSVNKKITSLRAASYCLRAMLKERLFKKRTPLSVVFYLSYKCNLKCPFCNFWAMEEEEMSTLQIFSLIDKLRASGTQRLGLVGGEPTLRVDVGQIIDYSKKNGLITTLCSNGLIEEKRIAELKGLDILLLSLDGPEEIHDKFRGKGTFNSVIRTIEIAKKYGLYIWLSTLIIKENMEYIDYIVNLAQSYGIQCSFQPAVKYSGSAKNMEKFSLTKEEIESVFKKLIHYKRNTNSIAISESYLKYMHKLWPEINSKNMRCFAGSLFCVVAPSGSVFACQPSEKKGNSSNLLPPDFRKAFYNVQRYDCKQCFCDSFIETNLLFNADLFTMWNIFKNFIFK